MLDTQALIHLLRVKGVIAIDKSRTSSQEITQKTYCLNRNGVRFFKD